MFKRAKEKSAECLPRGIKGQTTSTDRDRSSEWSAFIDSRHTQGVSLGRQGIHDVAHLNDKLQSVSLSSQIECKKIQLQIHLFGSVAILGLVYYSISHISPDANLLLGSGRLSIFCQSFKNVQNLLNRNIL